MIKTSTYQDDVTILHFYVLNKTASIYIMQKQSVLHGEDKSKIIEDFNITLNYWYNKRPKKWVKI